MGTVALELVPPSVKDGAEKAKEEAQKAKGRLEEAGIADRVNSLLIPGLIAEEEDRPVALDEKMDPLDVRRATEEELPLSPIVTQVTAFSSTDALESRIQDLRNAGIERVVFVGVPRTLADGQGPGMAPTDALSHFREGLPSRGVILIPTRADEKSRFQYKVGCGANFALSQILFSDHITQFLPTLRDRDERPEILLSFAYVPQAEQRVGLIQWLIQDENPLVQDEMAFVREIAGMDFPRRKQAVVDLYKRVIDGVHDQGFPLGLHLEAPYGFSEQAFETFHDLLEVWSP